MATRLRQRGAYHANLGEKLFASAAKHEAAAAEFESGIEGKPDWFVEMLMLDAQIVDLYRSLVPEGVTSEGGKG